MQDVTTLGLSNGKRIIVYINEKGKYFPLLDGATGKPEEFDPVKDRAIIIRVAEVMRYANRSNNGPGRNANSSRSRYY
jgi:hypothetical protein